MNPRVRSVKAINDHKLELRFSNGEMGIFDCSHLLGFGVFVELKDPLYFKRVRVIDGTVAWPNEQDLCPDTLYMESLKVA
jgi:hypothetical protein